MSCANTVMSLLKIEKKIPPFESLLEWVPYHTAINSLLLLIILSSFSDVIYSPVVSRFNFVSAPGDAIDTNDLA